MENKEGVRHFYANATELTASPLLTRRVRKLSQKPALFRSLARTQRQLVYVTLVWSACICIYVLWTQLKSTCSQFT